MYFFLQAAKSDWKRVPGHQHSWEASAKMPTRVWKMESRWPRSNWLSRESIIIGTCREERPKSKQNKSKGLYATEPKKGARMVPDSIKKIRGIHPHTGAKWPALPHHQQETGGWLWGIEPEGSFPALPECQVYALFLVCYIQPVYGHRPIETDTGLSIESRSCRLLPFSC